MPLDQTKKKYAQRGQTLIETIVAIFVLTMALLTSLGLTIYVLANSSNNTNAIIITNLAREGVEVVRMMRDTNWMALDSLAQQYPNDTVPNLQACSDIANKLCYPKAHAASFVGSTLIRPKYGYNLCGSNLAGCTNTDGVYALVNTSFVSNRTLTLYPLYYKDFVLLKNSSYLVCQGISITGYGFDSDNGACIKTGKFSTPGIVKPSNFYRSIEISHNYGGSFPGNDSNSNSEIVVKSTVAWTGKSCPNPGGVNPLPSTFRCHLTVEEHLTNWKDY